MSEPDTKRALAALEMIKMLNEKHAKDVACAASKILYIFGNEQAFFQTLKENLYLALSNFFSDTGELNSFAHAFHESNEPEAFPKRLLQMKKNEGVVNEN